MNAEHSELYRKIQAFPMNERGAVFPFAARLANDNGWSREYAERVIEEYKRFVFLTKAAGHSVCPSDQVDQAWHLHLTFTQSYWSEFCPDVLEGPLHHAPSQGGPAEWGKYLIWYTRTLASYRVFFDTAPPADIWPAPQIRFFGGTAYRRVETSRYFLVPREEAIAMIIVSGFSLGVYHIKWFGDSLEAFSKWGGASPVAATVLGMFAAFLGARLFRRWLRKPSREPVDADFDLDLYEAAYLANGAEGARNAALFHLAGRGMVEVDAKKGTFTRTDPLGPPYLPLEKIVHEALPYGKPASESDLRGSNLAALHDIATKLRGRGLLVSEVSGVLGILVPFFAFLAVGLLGLASLPGESGSSLLGTPGGWGAGFLTCLLILGLMTCLKPIKRTLLGDRVLERLQADSRGLHARVEADFGEMTPLLATTTAVALFGLGALPEKDPAREALQGGSDIQACGCG